MPADRPTEPEYLATWLQRVIAGFSPTVPQIPNIACRRPWWRRWLAGFRRPVVVNINVANRVD